MENKNPAVMATPEEIKAEIDHLVAELHQLKERAIVIQNKTNELLPKSGKFYIYWLRVLKVIAPRILHKIAYQSELKAQLAKHYSTEAEHIYKKSQELNFQVKAKLQLLLVAEANKLKIPLEELKHQLRTPLEEI